MDEDSLLEVGNLEEKKVESLLNWLYYGGGALDGEYYIS